MGIFGFWLKHPKITKIVKKKQPKSSICLIIFHISLKNPTFWRWPFFSNLWHGIALKTCCIHQDFLPTLHLTPYTLYTDTFLWPWLTGWYWADTVCSWNIDTGQVRGLHWRIYIYIYIYIFLKVNHIVDCYPYVLQSLLCRNIWIKQLLCPKLSRSKSFFLNKMWKIIRQIDDFGCFLNIFCNFGVF